MFFPIVGLGLHFGELIALTPINTVWKPKFVMRLFSIIPVWKTKFVMHLFSIILVCKTNFIMLFPIIPVWITNFVMLLFPIVDGIIIFMVIHIKELEIIFIFIFFIINNSH